MLSYVKFITINFHSPILALRQNNDGTSTHK